jgi:hypothetical protein
MRRDGARRWARLTPLAVVVSLTVGLLATGSAPIADAAPAGSVINTGRSGWVVQLIAGELVVFTVSEVAEQADLNGDGDTADSVPAVWDRATGVTSVLPHAVYALSTPPEGPPFFDADDQVVAFAVNESAQDGTDLNGDGDATDRVVHVWQRASGVTINLQLAVVNSKFPAVSAGAVVLAVNEAAQGNTDLDGDGNPFSDVLHAWTGASGTSNLDQDYGNPARLFTDSGRFGYALSPDNIATIFDTASGTSTPSNLGSSSETVLSGGWVLINAQESLTNTDLNGDGDTGDFVAHVWDGTTTPAVSLGVPVITSQTYPGGAGVFVFGVPENTGGGDLNGDGDAADVVAHVWSPSTGMVNLSVAGPGFVNGGGHEVPVGGGGVVAFRVPESQQGGVDLNSDGDAGDNVIHLWSPTTGLVNTATANTFLFVDAVRNGIAAWRVSEAAQGNIDLNGDSDTNDQVLHIWTAGGGTRNIGYAISGMAEVGADFVVADASETDQQADLNGDGSITGLAPVLVEPIAGTVTALPYSTTAVAAGDLAAIWVSESGQGLVDLNGDGDTNDQVVHAVTVDTNPPPTVSIADATVVEGDDGKPRNVQFAVTLSEPSDSEVSVDYTLVPTVPESASATADYNNNRGFTKTLRIKPAVATGLTPTTKYVTAKVTPDLGVEGDESFEVILSNPVGLVLGTASATGTIVDDDPGVGLRVSVGDASIWEGDAGPKATSTNNGKGWVNLSAPAASTVSVTVTVASGTATAGSDFKKAFTKTLTFKAGQWQKAISVPVLPGTTAEADETVTVTLSNPVGGLSLGRSVGTITILDDD